MSNKEITQVVAQLLIPFVVFSLIFPGNLTAKTGAQVLITKNDGQVIEGELLRVKEDSLFIMTSAANTGVTVDIHEVNTIGIKRKSKFGKGLLKGGLIGFTGGALLGIVYHPVINEDNGGALDGAIRGGIFFGVVCAFLGGIIGVGLKNYKTFQVTGSSAVEVKKILKKLKKKAHFKDA
jgi:hypothetical protein